jgi:hypothetical protein
MKKIIYSLTLIVIVSCSLVSAGHAQVRLSVGVNINSQPAWGPVGYEHVEYYYMPDIDAYYYVPARQYIYYRDNRWVRNAYLPPQYAGYDLYHGYKVVINDRDPWLRDDIYRSRYAAYRGRHDQLIIRDSRDERYRGHWDNGNHNGWYKQEDKGERKEMKREEREDKHGDD